MSDIIMSPYSHYGLDGQGEDAPKQASESSRTGYLAAFSGSAATVPPGFDSALMRDQTVAELAIRRLSKEIDYAKAELCELEQTVRYELYMPSIRDWLLPLMAIGLVLSFYGSFTSANSAEMGATGLMLLWSLSAFWFIYTRERRLEVVRKSNQAEIEIWSSRIEELQRSIEQNKRMAEPGRKDNATKS